jgi:2-polyprenyl-3-methyl-5-hydroxy-6-metoxy-1,4-benzoquinol methylase
MSAEQPDTAEYYKKLFTKNPLYSTPYPNVEEMRRGTKILEFLSQIPDPRTNGADERLRILDVGSGRGWLTHMASVFGTCDGVEPVEAVVDLARQYYPSSTYFVGTATDILDSPDFEPYDVVICSEVLEHVIDKAPFLEEIRRCLKPRGHFILTTPRGEEFKKYSRARYNQQPVEEWISERDLRELLLRLGFDVAGHDRAYSDLPAMSVKHALASVHGERLLGRVGMGWFHRQLRYVSGIYQVWWVQRRD